MRLAAMAAIVGAMCAVGSGQTTSGPPREFANLIGMKFVLIEPGTFLMGSDSGELNEKPVHKVTLTKGFYMQVTEVTQAQWRAVMGSNPSLFQGPDRPVEQVSWNDAQEFLTKLNAKERGARYRLPTEAEWEYAARAGLAGEPVNLDAVAWYSKNSGGETHAVGQKQANAWGLYDMLGNVWEWCADWLNSEYYGRSPSVDPPGSVSGTSRVVRGGCWLYSGGEKYARLAFRAGSDPGGQLRNIGFRCVRELSP